MELIKLYKNGSNEAFEAIIEKYKNPLYKFCCRLTLKSYEADDLFQDTWVKAVKKINTYDESKKFETWLFTIAVNTYKDLYRRAKIKLKFSFLSKDGDDEKIKFVQSDEPPLEEQVEKKDIKEKLKRNIQKLDDIYKIPLILFYFKEFSYDDISQILKIPVGTVKSRLNYAKKKLREVMEVK